MQVEDTTADFPAYPDIPPGSDPSEVHPSSSSSKGLTARAMSPLSRPRKFDKPWIPMPVMTIVGRAAQQLHP